MSASLVGSEMCIRDRLSAVTLDHELFRPGRARAAPSLFHRPRIHARAVDCLLYTSDAADDM
eukprot:10343681-Alexandrium_andersonii.AAC.1